MLGIPFIVHPLDVATLIHESHVCSARIYGPQVDHYTEVDALR